MFPLILFVGLVFSFPIFASPIDGKGLLCTCVESRSEPVVQTPKDGQDRTTDEIMEELFSVKDINQWQPLKCASKNHAYFLKDSLTGNTDDVDSFFFFEDGQVVQEILVQSGEIFEYREVAASPDIYVSDAFSISWGKGPYRYQLGRKSLILARHWKSESSIEVSQCQALNDVTKFQQAKDAYKRRFEVRYEEAKRRNGNRI